MCKQLSALGVKPGGFLLVHSSYKSLGSGVQGPKQVIETLRAALGESGTLVFPTLSYKAVSVDKRIFHIKDTPSDVGAISEYFRQMPGVVRSLHPTHSCAAIGPGAADITANNHLDSTPVGKNSPFRKLKDYGGQILMLGCGLRPNTSMHGVEELVQPPYLFRHGFTYACTGLDGVVKDLTIQRHHFENRHGDGVKQRYDRLKYLLPAGVLKTGKVLDATCHLIEAGPMWDIAEAVMREDPLFFVDCYADDAPEKSRA